MTDQPRRSRFRLSLRALMVIVLVAAGLMAWKANRARSQRRAIEAIKVVKGNVVYDYQYTGNEAAPGPFKRTEPEAPKWLRNALGDEYFQEVTGVAITSPVSAEILPTLATLDHLDFVSINGANLDDAAVAGIAAIPNLRRLSLTQSLVGDAGLANLARARKLDTLRIYGMPLMTDEGMAALASLPDLKSVEIMGAARLTALGLKNLGPRLAELEHLNIGRANITEDGLACLEACRKLKQLILFEAKIGDAGFAHFRNLESLELLNVSSTEVTDEGLAMLRGLKNLRSISLGRTRIAGPGLIHLEGLDKLETLSLGDSKLTDEGLDSIRKMKGLKTLFIVGAKVSPEAIAALKAARPSLTIISAKPGRPMPPGPPVVPPTPK